MTDASQGGGLKAAELSQQAEYETVHPDLETTEAGAKAHLRARLEEVGLKYERDFRLKSRVKRWDSLWPKVEDGRCRRWDDCPDLLGIKVIAVTSIEMEDCRAVLREYTERPPRVRLWHRSNGRSRGYSAVHAQIDLKFLGSVPEALGSRGAEVQLLTELQHAWDLVTHDDFYKSTEGVPLSVRERLFRVAGAIDLLDEEMKQARYQLEALRVQIGSEISNDEANASTFVDEVSILALSRAAWRTQLTAMRDEAARLGWRRSDWPELARCGTEMDALLAACEAAGITKVRQLAPYVEHAASPKWHEALAGVCSDYTSRLPAGEGSRLFNRPLSVLVMVLMLEEPKLSGPFFIPSISVALRRARASIIDDVE